MPKPIKFTYEKKTPFRDAFYLIIVCEGKNREPHYFRFFDGMSSRVKIVPVESGAGSAPKLLIETAIAKEAELDDKGDQDQLWFVIDTDRWREQLHEIRQACDQHVHWWVAQSNPCFEVWLYFHAKAVLPEDALIFQCNHWKPYLPTVIQGGFNNDFHPIAIETAILSAKASYKGTGYFPDSGSTHCGNWAKYCCPL
jgi:hypothetical protein